MERGEQARQALRPELIDDLLAHRDIEVGQHLRIESPAHDLDELAPFIVGQALQQVGQVGLVELGGERQDLVAAAGLKRVLDGMDQLVGDAIILLRPDDRWLDVLGGGGRLGHGD
jgi:hypothetical protein